MLERERMAMAAEQEKLSKYVIPLFSSLQTQLNILTPENLLYCFPVFMPYSLVITF